MTDHSTTLLAFLLDAEARGAGDPDLTKLLLTVASACQSIASGLRGGALAGVLGSQGTENVQGETQKKLDVIANDLFLARCPASGVLAAAVSEEMDEIYPIPEGFTKGPYVLFFDPLDGSSNIDINVSVGSIFSVLRLDERPEDLTYDAVLRAGTEQVAAGYAVYGPATQFVLTTGHGAHGFTLDTSAGEFRLTNPSMSIPRETSEFAINASRARFWEPPVKRYIDDCLAGETGPRGRNFNMRWVASMVADVHRVMLRGGVFMYPIDARNRAQGGKLRLFYEANPMSFLVEQAGGAASTGRQRILEVAPETPHQRVPVVLGSADEVAHIEKLHRDHDT